MGLHSDRGHADQPTGGPLELSVSDLREIVDALDGAAPELVEDFGLGEAALESDIFLVADAYRRQVERWTRDLWTELAFYDLDCDREEAI